MPARARYAVLVTLGGGNVQQDAIGDVAKLWSREPSASVRIADPDWPSGQATIKIADFAKDIAKTVAKTIDRTRGSSAAA